MQTQEKTKKDLAPARPTGYALRATDKWTCAAQVPDARGNRRVACEAENSSSDRTCRECGAPNQNQQQNRKGNMATPTNKQTPSAM